MTDCDLILERLDDLLEGRLSAAERDALELHLRDCPCCRELAALVGDELGRLAVKPPAGLADSILQRTSGSTCGSARARLCGYVDDEIGQVDRELVRLHLEGCEPCSALAGALALLATDLPALAGAEADERFVAGVLERTSGRRRPARRWAARLAAAWGETVRRPRFAWEAAYVATFVLALLFVTPASPLAGVQRTALDLAVARPAAELREPVARLEGRISAQTSRFWREARSRTAETLAGATEGAGRLTRSLGERIRAGLGTLSERLASMQEKDEAEDNQRSGDGSDREQGEGERR